jgi:hypothetical protein
VNNRSLSAADETARILTQKFGLTLSVDEHLPGFDVIYLDWKLLSMPPQSSGMKEKHTSPASSPAKVKVNMPYLCLIFVQCVGGKTY